MKKRFPNLILASQSPRRKELLSLLHVPFEIDTPNIEEIIEQDLDLTLAIEKLANQKAQAVASHHPDSVILAADTIVVYENHILGKPKDKEDAIRMLKLLSGKVHQVITAVCILTQEKSLTFHSTTQVEFYPLLDSMIEHYVHTGQPLDKAGAYGIQDEGALLVKQIIGDYYTVMGLPIALVQRQLIEFGFDF